MAEVYRAGGAPSAAPGFPSRRLAESRPFGQERGQEAGGPPIVERPRTVGTTGSSMPQYRKILIIDDDLALRHSLAEQLQLHEEFAAAEAGNAAEALDATKNQYFDAILLDVGLPDMDGRELCRVMRRNGVRAPILMLTGA